MVLATKLLIVEMLLILSIAELEALYSRRVLVLLLDHAVDSGKTL
jgi:hypothetical protein